MNEILQMTNRLITADLIFAITAGLAVLCIIAGVEQLISFEDPVARRLSTLPGARRRAIKQISTKEALLQLIRKLFPANGKNNHAKNKTVKALIMAGYRSPEAFGAYTAIRVVILFAVPASAVFIGVFFGMDSVRTVILTCFFGVTSLLIPPYALEKMVISRGKKINRELPDVLDLLVIAVEAGLGLTAAIHRVSSELSTSCPLLADELKLLSMEMKIGVPRDEALKNLASRTGVDDVSSLVTMLIQADRFGVSVGQSLRVHSEEVRTRKRQRLEEDAAKIPLKLLFPVLFLIFPAIMAAMAGPAVITIMESMFK